MLCRDKRKTWYNYREANLSHPLPSVIGENHGLPAGRSESR